MLITVFQIHPKQNLIILTFPAVNEDQGKQFKMLPIRLITCNLLPYQLLTVRKFKPLHGHLIKLPIPPMITYLVMRGTLGTLPVALFFHFVVISIDILMNHILKKILSCICYRQKGSLPQLLNASFSSLGI